MGGRLLVQAGGGYEADFDFLSAMFGPRITGAPLVSEQQP